MRSESVGITEAANIKPYQPRPSSRTTACRGVSVEIPTTVRVAVAADKFISGDRSVPAVGPVKKLTDEVAPVVPDLIRNFDPSKVTLASVKPPVAIARTAAWTVEATP